MNGEDEGEEDKEAYQEEDLEQRLSRILIIVCVIILDTDCVSSHSSSCSCLPTTGGIQ